MLAHYAATYSAYLERKKKEGKKPLSRAEWEARTQGGKAAGPHPKGNKPTKTWKKKYSPKVESVMDDHALTDDDANQVREFKSDKPSSGIPVSPTQLMQRFLAKAKPETRERMKGMTPAEFMQMLGAIMEDEEGAGKTASLRTRLIRLAAANPELRADLLPLLKEDANPASVDQNKPESYYGLAPRGIQASRPLGPGVHLIEDLSVLGPNFRLVFRELGGDFLGSEQVPGYYLDLGGILKLVYRTPKMTPAGEVQAKNTITKLLTMMAKQAGTLHYDGDTALDKVYAMTDLLAEVKRALPSGKGRAPEVQAVQKALPPLEDFVKTLPSSKQGSGFRTAKLMARQESILQKYMASVAASGDRAATGWDELPDGVRAALRRIKDQETLWMDVDRWFMDNAPARGFRWATHRRA